MEDKVPYFLNQGYVLVSVNYRLSPFLVQLDKPERIKHPDHIKDLAHAVRWVYDHIGEYGGNRNQMAIIFFRNKNQ